MFFGAWGGHILGLFYADNPRICLYFSVIGGAYISNTGVVKKINEYNHTVVLTDKTVIPIEQISEMQSDIFSEIY